MTDREDRRAMDVVERAVAALRDARSSPRSAANNRGLDGRGPSSPG